MFAFNPQTGLCWRKYCLAAQDESEHLKDWILKLHFVFFFFFKK